MSMKQSKVFKKFFTIVLAAVLVLLSVSPAIAKEAAKIPALNATNKSILVGGSFDFNIKNKIAGSKYEWTSSNTSVATVASNGVVKGISKGTTKITCRVIAPGGVYRLTADVKVVKPAVKVTITNPVETLNEKTYYKLRTSLTPASSNDVVSWSTSDKSIADVDKAGSFVARKAGTVTITAKTLSGRTDSVTIKVLKDGDAVEEKETAKEETKEEKKDVKVLKTILEEKFESNVGRFRSRGGNETIAHSTAGVAAEGKGYMRVSGRTANWHGATADITDLVVPGATYQVSAWVRYTAGADVEGIKISQERTSSDDNKYPAVAGPVDVKKGVWTKITGTMEVSPSTTKCNVYFEAVSLIDFFVDHVIIEQLDVEPIKEVKVEVPKAKVGDIVYKNDFENGSVLDSRGSSVRTNTTKYAKSGKASVEVKRTAGWDGAGVRFTAENNIVKASYYGRTVHTSVYVMYMDGPDEVQFKLNNRMEKADNSDNILTQKAVKKGVWTLIEAECYIAENAQGNIIFVETENNDALTFYIDDFNIKVVK